MEQIEQLLKILKVPGDYPEVRLCEGLGLSIGRIRINIGLLRLQGYKIVEYHALGISEKSNRVYYLDE